MLLQILANAIAAVCLTVAYVTLWLIIRELQAENRRLRYHNACLRGWLQQLGWTIDAPASPEDVRLTVRRLEGGGE